MRKIDTATTAGCLTTAGHGGMTCLRTFALLIMLTLLAGFSRIAVGQTTVSIRNRF
jgi:hypothetical protein